MERKPLCILSVLSLALSLFSLLMIALLFEVSGTAREAVRWFWIGSGLLCLLLPLAAKYRRLQYALRGRWLELAALVVGFFCLDTVLVYVFFLPYSLDLLVAGSLCFLYSRINPDPIDPGSPTDSLPPVTKPAKAVEESASPGKNAPSPFGSLSAVLALLCLVFLACSLYLSYQNSALQTEILCLEDAIVANWEAGYQLGYTEGHEQGSDEGYSTGYSTGYRNGSFTCKQDFENMSYPKFCTTFPDFVEQSYSEGYIDCYIDFLNNEIDDTMLTAYLISILHK